MFQVFIVPVEDCCTCSGEEDFNEEPKASPPPLKSEMTPCEAGTCDCEAYSKVSPFEQRLSADKIAFNELFTKYTEANKLITTLTQEKERDSKFIKSVLVENDKLRLEAAKANARLSEVVNALNMFEKRISTLD